MTKIVHLSDIHVKNLKYHEEQRGVFEEFYEHCLRLAPDFIIITGDLYHAKARISAEAYDLAAEFLDRTASIAETHLILGNHDTVLGNKNRLDSITPVVEALAHPDLHYHRISAEVEINDEITLNILSLLDRDKWKLTPTNPTKINIALFHGAVIGTETETGWVIEHGDAYAEQFVEFDYAMLGDIHGKNISIDDTNRRRYAGSLVQNHFGEFNDKGFLYWEIEDSRTYTCEHVHIPNPKPFVSITLTKKGNLPRKVDVPAGARLRIISETAISFAKLARAGEIARHKWNLEKVIFLNKAPRYNQDGTMISHDEYDLRDIAVQEELIRRYLKEFEVSEATMEEVYALNHKYNAAIADLDDVKRHVRWGVEEFEWDNFFNYGPKNGLNFAKLGGVVGIFGGNYTGKTASVDSLLYTMFNTTAKNEKKSVNVVNQNKNDAVGMVTLSIGDERYVIRRRLEKYTKTLKGKMTEEAKTELDFYRIDDDVLIPMHGETRRDTDKAIRNQFGTIDDFLLTAFASQHGALAYINEGSTKRKEILAKFLDLQMFEQKFRLAKEHSDEIRAALRKLEAEGIDYDELIVAANDALGASKAEIEQQQDVCNGLEATLAEAAAAMVDIEKKLATIPENIDEIMKARKALPSAEAEMNTEEDRLAYLNSDMTNVQVQKKKYDAFFKVYEKEECDRKYAEILELQEKIKVSETEIAALQRKKERQEKQIELLESVPCKGEYDCQFISEATASKAGIRETTLTFVGYQKNHDFLLSELSALNPDMVLDAVEKRDAATKGLDRLSGQIHDLEIEIHRQGAKVTSARQNVNALKEKVAEYTKNKDVIKNAEKLNKELDVEYVRKNLTASLIETCKASLLELYRGDGALEQKLKNLNESVQRIESYRASYSAYDLFLRAMHPSGISYEIIKQKLPIINEEIAKILTNVVNFEVFFENDDNKLNIYIRHPKYDKRPIELGSGAEKTLAAIAIRMALLDITSLPVPNFFVFDEPATDLDENNLEGFTRILEIIKTKFKVVFLISHLESLKDSADMQLPITKSKGFAQISF